MRPRFLIYNDAFEELGGPRMIARILAVEEGTVRKYAEDPLRSGREIPVPGVIELLQALAGRASTRAQELADELLAHFTMPARRRALREGTIEAAVEILRNGNGHVEPRCACGAILKKSGEWNGQPVWGCPKCHGMEAR